MSPSKPDFEGLSEEELASILHGPGRQAFIKALARYLAVVEAEEEKREEKRKVRS